MRGQPTSDFGAGSSWLQIDTSAPGYAGRLVPLVAVIARTPSGRAILEGIRESGGSVKIEKPEQTDPPNATLGRESSTSPTMLKNPSTKTGWCIGFDPDDWPSPLDPAGRSPEAILFLLLREALGRLRAGGEADARRVIAELDPEEAAAIARFQQERSAQ
jgi:hypothetical protein